jgi:hypothetical protein
MIVGVNKIKDLEFSFPIKNAPKAMYKIVSVNELSKTDTEKGNWGAVILAEHSTKGLSYIVPNHVVFTIEHDNDLGIPTYKITAITSDNDTAKIEVSKVAVSTPENFFKSLKEIAELIQFIV